MKQLNEDDCKAYFCFYFHLIATYLMRRQRMMVYVSIQAITLAARRDKTRAHFI